MFVLVVVDAPNIFVMAFMLNWRLIVIIIIADKNAGKRLANRTKQKR